jgi:hypothetical protein
LKKEKLKKRLDQFTNGLDLRYIQTSILCDKIIRGLYPFIPTKELDVLASETSATMSTQHPDYARLAARICISSNHKTTRSNFTHAMTQIVSENEEDAFLSPQLIYILQKRGKEMDNYINHDRDFLLSYFGYKTLEKSYLLKDRYTQEVVERPQYMFMRVALGIHCTSATNTTLTDEDESIIQQYYAVFSYYRTARRIYHSTIRRELLALKNQEIPQFVLGLVLGPLIQRSNWLVEFLYPIGFVGRAHLWLVQFVQRRQGGGLTSPAPHTMAMEQRFQVLPGKVYVHSIPLLLDNLAYLIVFCSPKDNNSLIVFWESPSSLDGVVVHMNNNEFKERIIKVVVKDLINHTLWEVAVLDYVLT